MSPILLLALVPYALCVLAACIALFAAAVEQLPDAWCRVAHRRYHFHGFSRTCCRKCSRLWVHRVFAVPGGKEGSRGHA